MYIAKLIFWSIPSWQRVPNPPILWRSPYITYPPPYPPNPFFKFCFISLNEWVVAPHLVLFIVLCFTSLHYGSTHVEPWYLSTTSTLRCVLWNKVSSLLSSKAWQDFLLLLWFDITKHTRRPRLAHPYKYILTPYVMCSKHLPALNWMKNLLASKIYITKFHNVFAFQKLTRNHISVDKIQ